MGRGSDFSVLFTQLFKYRDSQRRALNRVGSRAQLVDKAERTRVCELDNLNNICHVRREGRKRLLNALLVAYIHQNTAENAELAVVGAGHQKSAHSH